MTVKKLLSHPKYGAVLYSGPATCTTCGARIVVTQYHDGWTTCHECQKADDKAGADFREGKWWA